MRRTVVVVGSGAGGMTAAVTLAKEGRKVLVLEQHARPGGLMQSFRRGECCFPTGVHFVGSLAEGQILWRYFKHMGVLERLRPVPLEEAGFAEYVFPDMSFLMPWGAGNFRTRLLEQFPSEREAVERFVADMRRVVRQFPLYNLEPQGEHTPVDGQARSLQGYLDGLTGSEPLKAVLSAVNPFYGIDPAECPLYVHFLVLDSFLNSAWRLDDAAPLAEAFVGALRAAGGELRCRARVAAIECDGSGVRAVRLADGERIESGTVVFTGHPKHLPGLCEGGELRPAFKERLAEQGETVGIFGVGIRWEQPNSCLLRRVMILCQNTDTRGHYRPRGPLTAEPPHVVACSAAPNPAAGSCSVVALAPAPSDEWMPWGETRTGARPPDYAAAKQQMAERILAVLRAHWPQAAATMHVVDSFSPLTVRDYTLSAAASAYGLRKSVLAGRSGRLTALTRIHGLFLAGQSIILPGIVGTVISGVDAAAAILGRRHLVERIARETGSP